MYLGIYVIYVSMYMYMSIHMNVHIQEYTQTHIILVAYGYI